MANYYIGANDEHGQNPPTPGKRTPVMPYLNVPFYENQFNRPTKNKFIEGCLRNGLRVFDVKPEITDTSISERVRRINRQGLTLLVTFAYNAFGAGQTFNNVAGVSTFYDPTNTNSNQSRILSEEVYTQLLEGTEQRGIGVGTLQNVGVLRSVNCPSTLIEAGFMTNFEEAKLMLDPDFQTEVAEETLLGVCNYLGIAYVPRNNLANYQLLRLGTRGNFVMLLQFLLWQNGYDIDIDGIFGNQTNRYVVDFQQRNGLVADGIVGNNTWRTLLVLPPRPTIRQGSSNVYVAYLQQKLTSKLYPVGAIDGIFGTATKNAVMEFQRETGIDVDGIVGAVTWQNVERIGGGRPLPR